MVGDERKFENIQIKNLVPLLLKLRGTTEKETRDTNKPTQFIREGGDWNAERGGERGSIQLLKAA